MVADVIKNQVFAKDFEMKCANNIIRATYLTSYGQRNSHVPWSHSLKEIISNGMLQPLTSRTFHYDYLSCKFLTLKIPTPIFKYIPFNQQHFTLLKSGVQCSRSSQFNVGELNICVICVFEYILVQKCVRTSR